MAPTRFHRLAGELASSIQERYEEAQQRVRDKNPQRSGHEGESTWARFLEEWGPGWPIVVRKYLVGPSGETNEIDIVVLKPDYPAPLRTESSILISGVAAAFSSRLTLRRSGIQDALQQKKQIVAASGSSTGSLREILTGPFPLGLLCHGSAILNQEKNFSHSLQLLYNEIAHGSSSEWSVKHPREELDAILIADRAFLSCMRASLTRAANELEPNSWMAGHPEMPGVQGAPLAQFMTWLHSRIAVNSSVSAMGEMFGADTSSGYLTTWPNSIYPEHILRNRSVLVNEYGHPRLF